MPKQTARAYENILAHVLQTLCIGVHQTSGLNDVLTICNNRIFARHDFALSIGKFKVRRWPMYIWGNVQILHPEPLVKLQNKFALKN